MGFYAVDCIDLTCPKCGAETDVLESDIDSMPDSEWVCACGGTFQAPGDTSWEDRAVRAKESPGQG